ncbi:MAG: hypothetical protein J6A01_04835, partial [Proteobacteria bacterium]|nr:hypothetical protein [Pseudomonadota bacterium]
EGTCQPKDATTCDSDEACSNGMKCDEGVCKNIVNVGDPCDESTYCENSTCEDELCRHYGEVGETCDNVTELCQFGLECYQTGFCYTPLELGEECDEIEKICNSSYTCSLEKQICIQNAHYGDECGDEIYAECDSSEELQCYDGKCRKISKDNTCDENTVCPEGEICFESGCITKAECTKDEQCQADTYCCTEDTCETKNICVSYETGPRGKTNDECKYQTVPGLFEADIQCEWTGPEANEPFPDTKSVVTPVLVSPSPHDTGKANALYILTYPQSSAGSGDISFRNSVIRILNGENCKLLETVYDEKHNLNGGSPLAIADIDGDGIVEIFAARSHTYQSKETALGGVVAFKWSAEKKKYVYYWHQVDGLKQKTFGWGGVSLHDINGDGVPEVITPYGEVLDSKTGKKLNGDQELKVNSFFPVLGDLDNDGIVEYIDPSGNVYEWSIEKNSDNSIKSQQWVIDYPKANLTGARQQRLNGFADFGTPGATPEAFDWNHKDGIAEIVSTSSQIGVDSSTKDSHVSIFALIKTKNADGTETKSQQRIFFANGLFGGGAPTIGDYDGDNLPEVGFAFGDHYRVFDPLCKKNTEGCASEGVLWEGMNQDNSSYETGSSIFDFDADGHNEVVYADECYTRIYDGKSGDILFSARHTNRTVFEYPVVVDVDNDQSAEIVMGANPANYNCPLKDTFHRGVRCQENNDCTSNVCEDGFCRCTSDDECNWRKGADGKIKVEYLCDDPLEADKAKNAKKICRAQRPNKDPIFGIRVLRDRYDRWASSRNIWNQYSYSITNVNDDMTLPKTSAWKQNFLDPKLNNYRANSQGALGMNVAPDITGKLDKNNLCVISGKDNTITLKGVVCNRGTKTVGSKMPASFYQVKEGGELGQKYCTSYTSENVPVGGCLEVSCSLSGDNLNDTTIRMVVNDDGEGGRTTVECNSDNNTDEVKIDSCQVN